MLFYAIDNKNLEMLDYFLSKGISANQKNSNSQTPLGYAMQKNDKNTIVTLLKNGGHPDVTDSYGNNLLHLAATTNDFLYIVELIKLGVDPKLKNNDGKFPEKLAKTNKKIKKYLKKARKGKLKLTR